MKHKHFIEVSNICPTITLTVSTLTGICSKRHLEQRLHGDGSGLGLDNGRNIKFPEVGWDTMLCLYSGPPWSSFVVFFSFDG